MYQVKIVKTIVGWFNVYLIGEDQRINLSPEEFTSRFPQFSAKCKIACDDITVGQAVDIGFNVEAEVAAV